MEVLNPELHIATLTEDVEFHLELEVRMGKGYVPADMHEGLSEEIGLIKLDSSFSPVAQGGLLGGAGPRGPDDQL